MWWGRGTVTLSSMCGIVGYVSSAAANSADHLALDVLLQGLGRLEYRGYDSAGVAVVTEGGELASQKRAGKLANLLDAVTDDPLADARTGIGHTRWATHAGPTDDNAHPHLAVGGQLALIHNGIIENYAQRTRDLVADGVEFTSETDTEVAAHQLAVNYRAVGDMTEAMRLTVGQLEGAFTLLAVHADAADT